MQRCPAASSAVNLCRRPILALLPFWYACCLSATTSLRRWRTPKQLCGIPFRASVRKAWSRTTQMPGVNSGTKAVRKSGVNAASDLSRCLLCDRIYSFHCSPIGRPARRSAIETRDRLAQIEPAGQRSLVYGLAGVQRNELDCEHRNSVFHYGSARMWRNSLITVARKEHSELRMWRGNQEMSAIDRQASESPQTVAGVLTATQRLARAVVSLADRSRERQ